MNDAVKKIYMTFFFEKVLKVERRGNLIDIHVRGQYDIVNILTFFVDKCNGTIKYFGKVKLYDDQQMFDYYTI